MITNTHYIAKYSVHGIGGAAPVTYYLGHTPNSGARERIDARPFLTITELVKHFSQRSSVLMRETFDLRIIKVETSQPPLPPPTVTETVIE